MHLECPLCVELVPAPVIRDVGIFPPGGGKVPLQGEFCAEVEFSVPELAEEAVLRWDLDGDGLPDVESSTDECPLFTYQSCDPENVLVTVTAYDRFGRGGSPVERSLKLSCNQVPSISCSVVQLVAQPRPGDNLQFFVTGFDPDAVDPGSNRGVERFEIDFDGDGIFDQTIPGNRQELPINHSYALAGQFRPTIRAYDADGEYGVGTCDVVSVLEEFLPGDVLDLRFDVSDVAPLSSGWAGMTVTTGIVLFGDRTGILTHQNGSWMLDAVQPTPEALAGIERVGQVLIGGGNSLYTSVVGAGVGATSTTPWSACSDSPGPVTTVRAGGAVTRPILVVSGNSGVHVYDASAALTASAAATCTALLQSLAGPLSTPTVAGFSTTWATELAVAVDGVLYAAVSTRESAGKWGVVTYDLGEVPPSVWCGGVQTGCLETPARVRALAGQGAGQVVVPVTRPAFWAAGTGPVLYRLPRRAQASATGAARLWTDSAALAPATTTFWFVDDTHIAMDRMFATSSTFAASTTAHLTFEADAMVAIATDDGQLRVYDVETTTGGVAWALRDTVTAPVSVDDLVTSLPYVLVRNNSAGYDATGTTYMARQRRSVWAWPLDRRSGWVRLMPWRTTPRDDATWTGPRSVATDGDRLWIADGTAGLRLLPAERLLAATGSVSVVTAPSPDDIGIGGSMVGFAPVPSGTRLLAATRGGIAQVRLDRRSDERPRPVLEWLMPATDPVIGVSLLQTDDGRDLMAVATTQAVSVRERLLPDLLLARIPAVTPGAIRYAELLVDPDPLQTYLLYTFESDGQGSVVLWGLDDNPLRVNGRRTRFMQDLGADVQTQSLGAQAPIVSRLAPSSVASRTMALFFLGFDRLCIEPFWGGTCPVDHLGNTVLLMPSTVGGTPWPLSVRGRRLIVRTNAVSGLLTVQDRDGLVIRSDLSPCASVEEILQFACVSGNTMRSAANADPFWLQATDYGIFIFDFSAPIVPRLVTSDFASGRKIRGMVGLKDGVDLLVGYHCDGSGSACGGDDNGVLRTFLVRGVVPQ